MSPSIHSSALVICLVLIGYFLGAPIPPWESVQIYFLALIAFKIEPARKV